MFDKTLLFRLSGFDPAVPEVHNGSGEPNFLRSVESIDDERFGKVLRCHPSQLLAYRAPGNIYSERGTISFFWRSREALGETEFPLFRVAFADHSSWDALFIRIDYNGSGIDAFATDINLSRLRLSHHFDVLPSPDEWIHIMFTWDENIGVSLFVNGECVGEIRKRSLLYAGLDQFGTHSRIISNAQVQSSYNYMRTGDFAEIRIYGRMLGSEDAARLAAGKEPEVSTDGMRSLSDPAVRAEWDSRFGFDCPAGPYHLTQRCYTVRKVEIHEAYDHKRWWWKACDGIRETTWPGVYNRSRLPGRLDYFVLPDWDCYSVSGKKITFFTPRGEEFNCIAMSGSAHGMMCLHTIGGETPLETRRESSERSFLCLPEPMREAAIEFENDEIEEPIGDISLFDIHPGTVPAGRVIESYHLNSAVPEGYEGINAFIRGRMMEDERFTLYPGSPDRNPSLPPLPFVNIAIRYRSGRDKGLDGVLVRLPGIGKGDGLCKVNIQVRDPLWWYRNLINASFSIKEGSAKEIFLDTRDRILPEGGVLYMTIASSEDLDASFVSGLSVDLVFKSREEAKAEHIADRLTQVRDNYANLVEENPSDERFNMFRRFKADLDDLLDVDPDNRIAQEYRYDKFKVEAPSFVQSQCPDSVPRWAWRQIEYMARVKRFLSWWIDKRQIGNGEFGGGLSDDGDLTAWWPGPAIAGCMPDKIARSLRTEMEAFYDQGMFTNGLCSIQTDQLHTLEEGIQALGQCLTLFPDDPLYIERAMDNCRGIGYVTGYTEKGHRHFMSGYYSGVRIAMEHPWRYSASDSFHVLHPTYMLARYNGSPKARKLILELADSMLCHYYDGRLHVLVDTVDETDQVHERTREWPLFYAAYDLTGDRKYLEPIDPSLYALPQDRLKGKDPEEYTADRYETLLRDAALREYINTDGQLWVDRCVIDISALQEDRCGGIAHIRFSLYPRHFIRWRFDEGQESDVAILVTEADPTHLVFRSFCLSDSPVHAVMVPDNLREGRWSITSGSGKATFDARRFGPGVDISFMPGSDEYTLSLEKEKERKELPDLAISAKDVIIRPDCIRTVVHNIGAVASVRTRLVLKDASGKELRHNHIPPIEAPVDLYPKSMEIPLWTRGLDLKGCTIEIDPEGDEEEISRMNNTVRLEDVL